MIDDFTLDDIAWKESREVLAECKVLVRRGNQGFYHQSVIASPLENVPTVMMQESCWKTTHWEFTTIQAPVMSTYDTWCHAVDDTWKEQVCLLQLRKGGFVFQKLDKTLLEQGAGI